MIHSFFFKLTKSKIYCKQQIIDAHLKQIKKNKANDKFLFLATFKIKFFMVNILQMIMQIQDIGLALDSLIKVQIALGKLSLDRKVP